MSIQSAPAAVLLEDIADRVYEANIRKQYAYISFDSSTIGDVDLFWNGKRWYLSMSDPRYWDVLLDWMIRRFAHRPGVVERLRHIYVSIERYREQTA